MITAGRSPGSTGRGRRPQVICHDNPRNRELVAALPVLTLRLPPMPVSSSAVRARAAAGLPLAGWVPPAVAGYIESHRLYRAPRSPAAPDRSPSSGS